VTIPAEFNQMFEDRKKIVIGHVEQLRVALGDTSFKKLETYILSTNPALPNEAKPKTTPTTTTRKKRKREPLICLISKPPLR
jgi:hypothetical protein